MWVAVGILSGLVSMAGIGRFLAGVLYEIDPLDPTAYGLAVALMATVGAGACVVPLRRALRIDPAISLRND